MKALLCLAVLAAAGSPGRSLAFGAETDQVQIVAALSGSSEIAPGVTITDRYSDANRRQVRTYLAELLSSIGLSAKTQDYRSEGKNVYGILPATVQPSDTVLLGAHFDSVRGVPGANDNATGVALVQAVAAHAATLPCRSRDLMVAYFDEEERGLVGSGNFARWLKSSGIRVHSVHTVDQMGWDEDGDRAIEIEQPTPALRQFYGAVAEKDGVTLEKTATTSTDHQSFRSLGFPAVGLTEEYVNGDTTPYYHQPGDKFDTVNFDYLEASTAFVSAVFDELLTEGCK